MSGEIIQPRLQLVAWEITADCNLSCALCPVTKGLERPQGHMDPALFRRLLDETGDFVFTLLFWDWGEPFVNPDIFAEATSLFRPPTGTFPSHRPVTRTSSLVPGRIPWATSSNGN